MQTLEEHANITVRFPRTVLDRLSRTAAAEQTTEDHEIVSLVEEGLDSRLSTRELFEKLSDMYRSRLAREGKLEQTPEEVFAELARFSERIAHDLYAV